MTQPARWPLHPQPGPLESLSSWLERTARPYQVTARDLLTRCLGRNGAEVPEVIDWDPPPWVLDALAERTGASLVQLKAMTLAGQVPWLMDAFPMRSQDAQETFDTYVRQNSVILAPGEAGPRQMNRRARGTRWAGPWRTTRPDVPRTCPVCAGEPDPRRALAWDLPLTAGCHEHGCELRNVREIALAAALGEKPPPVPVPEPLAALDRRNYQALASGRVALPGREVHAGVWFRLLRSLLDEVSIADSHLTSRSRSDLEHVWRETDRPRRGGLTVWRPYEEMDWPMQEAMLHAAAVALQMAADGLITPRGVLGSAVRPAPRVHVYDGDQPHRDQPRPDEPHRDAWAELMEEVAAAVDRSRTDPGTARQFLAMLTIGCRTLDSFEEQRSYLFGIGIPAEFLPPAREFGRTDLA